MIKGKKVLHLLNDIEAISFLIDQHSWQSIVLSNYSVDFLLVNFTSTIWNWYWILWKSLCISQCTILCRSCEINCKCSLPKKSFINEVNRQRRALYILSSAVRNTPHAELFKVITKLSLNQSKQNSVCKFKSAFLIRYF